MTAIEEEELRYCLNHQSTHRHGNSLPSCQMVERSEWPKVFGSPLNDLMQKLKEHLREHGIVNLGCSAEPECNPIEALAEFIQSREATLSQQYERARKEEFELAQQAFQISLAAVKEFYEQEKKRLEQQSNGGKNNAERI